MEVQTNCAISGVFVRPELVSTATWDTKTETYIENRTGAAKHVMLKSRIVDDDNVVFGRAATELDMEPNESVKVIQSVLAYGVQLCDMDEPEPYTMVSELYNGDTLAEERHTRFGYHSQAIAKLAIAAMSR